MLGLVLFSQGGVEASLASQSGSHDIRDQSRAEAAKVPLRLMPLGASITYGLKSSDGNGYRQDLRQMLVRDGYRVDMVGSRKAGSMSDNDNEGWPGLRIEQVQAKGDMSVPRLKPNLVAVNAGTNDCAQNFDIAGAGGRMNRLLESVWAKSPRSTIILSTLLVNGNSTIEARVLRVNEQLRSLARRKAAAKKRMVLAEMHGADGPRKDDLVDGTHPNDAGYNKMAKIWHKGIQEAASKGFLQRPA
ncbi:hypothetical protein G6O67_001617 [Ophiocordyceps sinensis]|uniref:SGNH hydrolase-type esterase domain-containing protein n=1 Tax=Ophiocordyceps sinensis TaxID=72228 RepID=A0A8H4PXZ8_9HYPO|nr:hypothetical protein G6O67_001617 [Ophiocordyceps sinensis]